MARETPILAPAYLIQDAPTRLQGQVFELKAGKVLRIPGGNPPRHRKYIRITNEDTNTNCYLVAGEEQSIDPETTTIKLAKIRLTDSIEFWTNATIYLKNIAPVNAISDLQVLELFYV